MKTIDRRHALATAVTCTLALTSAHAADAPTPGFNNKIPEQVTTPDTVDTRIGTLKFVDGVPTIETTETAIDQTWKPGEIEAVK